ncbi:hypothetical protein M5K25_015766 [Dendrobium thyrsiflorum]|uniref:Uncharacterized protein n=1 Tax=Dendrobium thyrsiflorum TaxID=117978 RepID=A0ABD0URY0_DENTH
MSERKGGLGLLLCANRERAGGGRAVLAKMERERDRLLRTGRSANIERAGRFRFCELAESDGGVANELGRRFGSLPMNWRDACAEYERLRQLSST